MWHGVASCSAACTPELINTSTRPSPISNGHTQTCARGGEHRNRIGLQYQIRSAAYTSAATFSSSFVLHAQI